MKSKQVEISLVDVPGRDGAAKQWVCISLRNGKDYFLPSFQEIAYIIWMIGLAEQKKYPFGRGYLMVADFISEAIQSFPQDEWEMDSLWERISRDSRFKLPGWDRPRPDQEN